MKLVPLSEVQVEKTQFFEKFEEITAENALEIPSDKYVSARNSVLSWNKKHRLQLKVLKGKCDQAGVYSVYVMLK